MDRQNAVNINRLQEELQRLWIAVDNIEQIIQAAEDRDRPERGDGLQIDPGNRRGQHYPHNHPRIFDSFEATYFKSSAQHTHATIRCLLILHPLVHNCQHLVHKQHIQYTEIWDSNKEQSNQLSVPTKKHHHEYILQSRSMWEDWIYFSS